MFLESDVSNETKHLDMCQWYQKVLDFLFWNYRRSLRLPYVGRGRSTPYQ